MNSEVTLSTLWKTRELRQVAIAVHRGPCDRAYDATKRIGEPGKTQMYSRHMTLTMSARTVSKSVFCTMQDRLTAQVS